MHNRQQTVFGLHEDNPYMAKRRVWLNMQLSLQGALLAYPFIPKVPSLRNSAPGCVQPGSQPVQQSTCQF